MKSAIAAAAVKDGRWSKKIPMLMGKAAADRLQGMSVAELALYLERHLTCPTDFTVDMCGEFLEAYFAASWAKTFEMLDLPKTLSVLEIASGDAVPVPFGLDCMSEGQGSYVTANLNRELTAQFYEKVKPLGIHANVVEDDAANTGKYYATESFEVVAFQHAVNDVIQTIIADREGLDTVNSNWWDILPEMTRLTASYYNSNRLQEACYPGFIGLIQTCYDLLKPGGYMVFNNTVYQYDLNLGYPLELYKSYIPLARKWIAASGMKLTEVVTEEYDRQWWMILKKG